MRKYYKVTGRFEVFNSRGNIIDGRFFLNKIFLADCPKNAMQKAVTYMKGRKSKKYGKRAILSQVSDIIVNTHLGGPPKKRSDRNKKQLAFPFFGK